VEFDRGPNAESYNMKDRRPSPRLTARRVIVW
jgi:hypothetical protein